MENKASIKMRWLGPVAYILCLWLTQCTTQEMTGGSGVETTGGQIVAADGVTPVSNASVSLHQVQTTSTGDSVIKSYKIKIGEDGFFDTDNVDPGKYVLIAMADDSSVMTIDTDFEISGGQRTPQKYSLLPTTILRGRVLLLDSLKNETVSICIPGLNKCSVADNSGIYTLAQAPQGKYELLVHHGDEQNALLIDVIQNTEDTTFVRDVLPVNVQSGFGVIDNYSFTKPAYVVAPQLYRPEIQPNWYKGKEFNFINYKVLRGDGDRILFDTNQSKINPFILDLNFTTFDDLTAQMLALIMMARGEAEVLGMMGCSYDPYVKSAIEGVNSYYGFPDIPIGVSKDTLNIESQMVTQYFADSVFQNTTPIDQVNDAVVLYRQILASRPDKSTDILTHGGLSNLSNLLNSPPDGISPLSGRELILRKVKSTIIMGGAIDAPDSTGEYEYNFRQAPTATQNVVSNWPIPILFSPKSVGVMLGDEFKQLPVENPIYIKFNWLKGLSASWETMMFDVPATLYTILGGGNNFSVENNGSLKIFPTGYSVWTATPDLEHSYLIKVATEVDLRTQIADLIMGAGK